MFYLEEETNLTIISNFASKRIDPANNCYFINPEGIISDSICQQQLHYICVKPMSAMEWDGMEWDVKWRNITVPVTGLLTFYYF